jgi:hypothetical protein
MYMCTYACELYISTYTDMRVMKHASYTNRIASREVGEGQTQLSLMASNLCFVAIAVFAVCMHLSHATAGTTAGS